MHRRFALAPMSPVLLILTGIVCALPALFIATALLTPAGWLHIFFALLLAAICASIWLFLRPQTFTLSPSELTLRFPARRKQLACAEITAARLLEPRQLRAELGRAYRVGAGGPWGGFGWLSSAKRGWVEFYISRLDGYVLIERGASTPLLITPEEPARFVEALERVCPALRPVTARSTSPE